MSSQIFVNLPVSDLPRASPRDYGFMYQRSVADPDGHVFEVFYMNEAEFPGA